MRTDDARSAMFLPRSRFDELLAALAASGYRCVGPTVREGAVVYDTIVSSESLPRGVRVTQAPGRYSLERTADARWFAWANGPQALKPYLFAPSEPLWRVTRAADGHMRFRASDVEPGPLAAIGVRACDLAALALLDRHFLDGPYPDPPYAARRADLFVVAVSCSEPAQTCFCVSTGDGPRPESGFDILLEESTDGFVAWTGSERGVALMNRLAPSRASSARLADAAHAHAAAVAAQTRRLPSGDLQRALAANSEHPRWNEVAERCLSCGNCTAVCPTCFCHSEHDEPTLSGAESAHVRRWDSCFSRGHSYMHGFVVRPDTRSRYRQWLTHKLGTWHTQYGRSGCVGCGRCIAWCPVGIDLTEEAHAVCGGAT